MYVFMGATGHIGSALVSQLRAEGKPLIAITRSPDQARRFTSSGVQGLAVDVADTKALSDAFRNGKRAFILNPPAPPALDTDAEETALVN
ncbi:NAD(P)H-binding protein [Neorhizobium sp. BT27B]|uniref:SDR family oxidoreductase n=1 Tax=Neorhizobium sp. BT27B TaxID=3142625 RepID=UPI003D280935